MDHVTSEIIGRIAGVTEKYLLVGAYARDELCRAAKVELGAVTQDIDIAVVVPSEAAFFQLKERLKAVGFEDGNRPITMKYKGFPVDLVPFGGIAKQSMVRLGADAHGPINVAGFEQAMKSSIFMSTVGGFKVRIPSPSYFVYLKFRAHMDRKNGRDASDLSRFIQNKKKFYPELESACFDPYATDSERLPDLDFDDYLFFGLGQLFRKEWRAELAGPVCEYLEQELANRASPLLSQMGKLGRNGPSEVLHFVRLGLIGQQIEPYRE
jgi:hypothetical protein